SPSTCASPRETARCSTSSRSVSRSKRRQSRAQLSVSGWLRFNADPDASSRLKLPRNGESDELGGRPVELVREAGAERAVSRQLRGLCRGSPEDPLSRDRLGSPCSAWGLWGPGPPL